MNKFKWNLIVIATGIFILVAGLGIFASHNNQLNKITSKSDNIAPGGIDRLTSIFVNYKFDVEGIIFILVCWIVWLCFCYLVYRVSKNFLKKINEK